MTLVVLVRFPHLLSLDNKLNLKMIMLLPSQLYLLQFFFVFLLYTTTPFTLTLPAAISASAALRESTPQSEKNFCNRIRSPPLLLSKNELFSSLLYMLFHQENSPRNQSKKRCQRERRGEYFGTVCCAMSGISPTVSCMPSPFVSQ